MDKIEKLAAGIESCWDIFSVENHHYFVNIAYGFTKASSKCKGWQGWLIRFRLILPSLEQKENLFGKYQKSFWVIPKVVDRAIELRRSKSTSKLWEKGQYLLNKATEIDNSEKGILLPYLNLGRTPEEQLEKNKPAMAWAKARMEEIKRKYNGKDLSLIDNSEQGILLPYLKHLGRTPEEQLEKNQGAMAWAKARMEEIKREYNGENL
ncbi:MAG: hypothetical protein F6K17_42380 [Okeania sp. SIO3C4]|nr:hypothetical protein [Okeania sp. SIO3C4]